MRVEVWVAVREEVGVAEAVGLRVAVFVGDGVGVSGGNTG